MFQAQHVSNFSVAAYLNEDIRLIKNIAREMVLIISLTHFYNYLDFLLLYHSNLYTKNESQNVL